MNIDNLQQEVPNKIYVKARTLCRYGRVKNILRESRNIWNGEVSEHEHYIMEVCIDDNGEARHWYCDCLYPPGTMCIHVVALIIQLKREWKKRRLEGPACLTKVHPPRVIPYFRQIKAYSAKIRKVLKNSKHERFAANPGKVAGELSSFINLAKKRASDGGYEEAFAILFLVIKLTGESYEDFYDDCSIADQCNEASLFLISLINDERVPKLPELLTRDFGRLLSNDDYFAFELARIEDIISAIASRTLDVPTCMSYIDEALQNVRNHAGIHSLVKHKITFLRQLDKNNEVEPLINRFLHIPQVRKMKADMLCNEGRYSQAVALLTEGIQPAQEDGQLNSVIDLEEHKLSIFQALGHRKKALRTIETLFIQSKDGLKYYHLLKQAIAPEDWGAYARKLANTIDISCHPELRDIFIHTYMEEKMWDCLLTFVEKHLRLADEQILERYDSVLKTVRPDRTLRYYRSQIESHIGDDITQEDYKPVARVLSRMKKYPQGVVIVAEIIAQVERVHFRRRKLIKELQSI
ncbi:MAG: hypothetical protein LBH04_09635 [Tannerellaceae bacterium]|jgi:tetratricopeptide (TPR) repeat protein|nr:hypothetical protein [Tannerellaceae bacterium]